MRTVALKTFIRYLEIYLTNYIHFLYFQKKNIQQNLLLVVLIKFHSALWNSICSLECCVVRENVLCVFISPKPRLFRSEKKPPTMIWNEFLLDKINFFLVLHHQFFKYFVATCWPNYRKSSVKAQNPFASYINIFCIHIFGGNQKGEKMTTKIVSIHISIVL